jgi:hypothetical protein
VASPRSQRGRLTAWASSSVREALLRPLYRGEIVWNQSRKRDRWGQSKRIERPAADWLHVPAPSLQIVPDTVWTAAQTQFVKRQEQFANAGRRRLDIESRYLLSGFARFGVCGGGLATHSRQHGQERVHFYGCTSFWKRGASVCGNNLVARMDAIDAEVLATLQDDILRPSVVEQAIALALEELSPRRQVEARGALEGELSIVRAECKRSSRPLAAVDRWMRCSNGSAAVRPAVPTWSGYSGTRARRRGRGRPGTRAATPREARRLARAAHAQRRERP